MPSRKQQTAQSGHRAQGAPGTRRRSTSESAPSRSQAPDPGGLLRLQGLAGNAAVTGVMAPPTIQRDDPAGKGGTGKSIEIIFIIRKADDKFTEDMTQYVKTTLQGQEHREVNNLEDICAAATALAAKGVTLSRVRIVGHGQTNVGGVGMTPKGEKSWRFVRPDEVKAYMEKPECKGLRAAMAADAQVEFWGCYLGGIPAAGEAWAGLFGKPVKSTTAEMKVGRDEFEIGRGRTAKSSTDVPKGAQKNFRAWLLQRYEMLRSTGEAPKLGSKDEKIEHMTDLFNRSGGVIRSRVVQKKGGRRVHRPGTTSELELWETTQPQP
jgi:hypothetical protein